jgi:hypothetical protein
MRKPKVAPMKGFESLRAAAKAGWQSNKQVTEPLSADQQFEKLANEISDGKFAHFAAEQFAATGNPLFALIAIGRWPDNQPLPELISMYLRDACREIQSATLTTIADKSPFTNEDANAAVLRALGITGDGRKGSNAFAELRDNAKARSAAKVYSDARAADPRRKITDIVNWIANGLHLSPQQTRKLVKKGQAILSGEEARMRKYDLANAH